MTARYPPFPAFAPRNADGGSRIRHRSRGVGLNFYQPQPHITGDGNLAVVHAGTQHASASNMLLLFRMFRNLNRVHFGNRSLAVRT